MPLVAIDRAGRVACANAAARGLLAGGVRRGAASPKLVSAGCRDRLRAEIAAALRGGPPRAPLRVALAGAPGAWDVAVVALAPPATGALLRFTDLGGRRELEAQSAHSQRLQSLGQFAAGVAHDFNNLLGAILGGAASIAEWPGVPTGIAEDAAQIRASAERGADLARRLLAFGGPLAPRERTTEVPAAIAALSPTLRRLLGGAIRLEVATPSDPAAQTVLADPVELDQVLVNLVANARDAMPGGGRLWVESRAVTLDRPRATVAGAVPRGRWVVVEVRDDGVGIAAETLPLVCDRYFTTRAERGGSGLGLATVSDVVRRAGGFLDIESALGEGTRVRVWLPARGVPGEPRTPADPPPAAATAPRTVLLVDDEEPLRRLAERALVRQGWRVLAVDSAESALVALDAEPADAPPLAALVSDVVLPGLDGVALVEAIRVRAGLASLPALLVSGYADVAPPPPPGVGFLPKPYMLGELLAQLADLAGGPPIPTPATTIRISNK